MYSLLAENWLAFALRGFAALTFGILAFLFPNITLTVLIILFGSFALIDGILSFAAAINHTDHDRWRTLLLQGIIGIMVGIVTLFWPGITTLWLLSFIAAWAIITGIFEVLIAIKIRQE